MMNFHKNIIHFLGFALLLPIIPGCGERSQSPSDQQPRVEKKDHHLAQKPLKLLSDEKSRALLLQEGIEQAEQRSLNYKRRLNASQFLPKPKLTKPKNEKALSFEETIKDLKGTGQVKVTFQTNLGNIVCQIDPSMEERKEGAAHFISLARGHKSWWNRRVTTWSREPFFDNTVIYKVFHKKGFYGGYPPEAGESQLAVPSLTKESPAKNVPAYTLGMLYQKGTKLLDTNFAITTELNTFLDDPFFPIGECGESDTIIHAIAGSDTTDNGIPLEEIRLIKVTFSRI